jgi:hypothetical protein
MRKNREILKEESGNGRAGFIFPYRRYLKL